jgi:hypothetical protein
VGGGLSRGRFNTDFGNTDFAVSVRGGLGPFDGRFIILCS